MPKPQAASAADSIALLNPRMSPKQLLRPRLQMRALSMVAVDRGHARAGSHRVAQGAPDATRSGFGKDYGIKIDGRLKKPLLGQRAQPILGYLHPFFSTNSAHPGALSPNEMFAVDQDRRASVRQHRRNDTESRRPNHDCEERLDLSSGKCGAIGIGMCARIGCSSP